MKMTTAHLLLGATLLAGCATPFRAPAGLESIILERGDSPVVRVEKIWLERQAGSLVVKGFVLRREEGADTTGTHLDVTVLDASGRVLHAALARFEPGRIAHARRHPDDASYAVVLDPLPASAARIRVQAHEGSHP